MNVAIITAKGNNSLKQKNLIKVCGKSFLQWQIETALNTPGIEEVYVSSEDPSIIKEAIFCKAKIIHRPFHLSLQNSNHGDVIQHATEHVAKIHPELSIITILLGNTAMVRKADIEKSLNMLEEHPEATGVMSVWKAQDDHPLRAMRTEDGFLKSFLSAKNVDTNRQSYEDVYFYDQGPWTFRRRNFDLKENKGPGPWWWMGNKCLFFEREWVTGRDIHTQFDIDVTEWWIKNYRNEEF